MSDRLPYEEQLSQQWKDLPLPDENMAWADMKRRLDEDNDNGFIPFWLRGCGLWGLLIVVMLAIGWWLIRPEKWWHKKEMAEKAGTTIQKENPITNKNTVNPNDTIRIINSDRRKTGDSSNDISKNDIPANSSSKHLPAGQQNMQVKKESDISVHVSGGQSKKKEARNRRQTIKEPVKKNQPAANGAEKKQIARSIPGKKVDNKLDISPQTGIINGKIKTDSAQHFNKPVVTGSDSLNILPGDIGKTDSTKKNFPDTATKKVPEQITKKENEQKKDSSKRAKFSFSAGVAMQQLLPVAGQKLTPYNSLGRKGSLADYIPSIYFRVYKDDKWFLQSEFKYGAPQYTKEFLYEQNFKIDYIGQDTIATSSSAKLKKTFYHQLPLTLNYFVLPDWSIGAGIVWNKFVGAVSERDVFRQINNGPVDSLLVDGIGKDTNTSVFAKTYLHAAIETQYRWKRFSFGARYAFGLQPYIKFTLSGGTQQQEKNKSLQIFLRYELWKSGKKKK